jgi:hypothetical protein
MAKRRRHLRLVSDKDSSTVFDDLEGLQHEQRLPTHRRGHSRETFARIPHEKAFQLCRRQISWAAWALLIELDRIILKGGGRNPVKLWSPRLRALGIRGERRQRALRQLEAAGVISVRRRRHGPSPLVAHHWFELRP